MTYNTITFEDGSNPYICKTEAEFEKMKKKYEIKPTAFRNFFIARALKKRDTI